MDINIPQQLIEESLRKVAGVNGSVAEPHDKIIVVVAAMWSSIWDGKSKRSRAAEAAIPLGGSGIVGGFLIALFSLFGVG